MAELYTWPKGVTLCLPLEEGGSLAKYANSVVVHEESLKAGFRLPMPGYARDLLRETELCPAQITPNTWRLVAAYGIRCWEMKLEPSIRGLQSCFEMREIGDVFCLYSSRGIDLVENPRDVSNWKRKWFLVTKGEGYDFNFPVHPGSGASRLKSGGAANELLGKAKELKDALESFGEGQKKVKYTERITWENLEKAGLSLPRPTAQAAGMKSGQSLRKSEIREQVKGSHSPPSKCGGASKKQSTESHPPDKEEERPAKKRAESARVQAKGSYSPPSKIKGASKKQTTNSNPPPENDEERPAKKIVETTESRRSLLQEEERPAKQIVETVHMGEGVLKKQITESCPLVEVEEKAAKMIFETANMLDKGSHSPRSKRDGALKKRTTLSRSPPRKEEERPFKKRVEIAHVGEGILKKKTIESCPPVKDVEIPAKKRVETVKGPNSPVSKAEGASKKHTLESRPPVKEEERPTKPGSPISQQCRDRTQYPKSETRTASSPVRPLTKSPTHQSMRPSSIKPSVATEAPHFSEGKHKPPQLQNQHDYLVANPALEEAKGLLTGATVNANAVSTLWRLPDEQVSAEFARATALQIYHANNLIKKHDKLLSSYLGSCAKLEELRERFHKEEEKLKHEVFCTRKFARQNEETSKKDIQILKRDLQKAQEEKVSLGFQARGMQKANEKLQRQVEEQHHRIQELERTVSRLRRERPY